MAEHKTTHGYPRKGWQQPHFYSHICTGTLFNGMHMGCRTLRQQDTVHKEVSADHCKQQAPFHEQLQQPSMAHRCDKVRSARLLDKRLTSLSSLLEASRALWASRSATSTSRLDMLAVSIHCSTDRSLSLHLQSCLMEQRITWCIVVYLQTGSFQ